MDVQFNLGRHILGCRLEDLDYGINFSTSFAWFHARYKNAEFWGSVTPNVGNAYHWLFCKPIVGDGKVF